MIVHVQNDVLALLGKGGGRREEDGEGERGERREWEEDGKEGGRKGER